MGTKKKTLEQSTFGIAPLPNDVGSNTPLAKGRGEDISLLPHFWYPYDF
jgi:hypothetical protein